MLYVVFLFFKQKTAYEMRISDWSSDVCSSDLGAIFGAYGEANATIADWHEIEASGMTTLMVPEAAGGFGGGWSDGAVLFRLVGYHAVALPIVEEIGRASCRERVCQYVLISVVAVSLHKKKRIINQHYY